LVGLVAAPGIERPAVKQRAPHCCGLLSPAGQRGSDDDQYCVEGTHQSPSYFTPRCSSASDGQPFHSGTALFPRYCRSSIPILLVQKPLAVKSRKLLKKAAP